MLLRSLRRDVRLVWWSLLTSVLASPSSSLAQDLTASTLDAVRLRMNESSTQSWEMGTASEALLEWNYPQFSVFSSSPAFVPSGGLTADAIAPVLYFAKRALSQKNGTQQIIADGAAGDPASLGVAVMLGNLTGTEPGIVSPTGVNRTNITVTYLGAAQDQLSTLLYNTPRAPNGAISHRRDELALWSDNVYMVPPFLAYYGVVTQNTSLIAEAVRQIGLYRDVLRDSSQNLWSHVLLSNSFNDPALWGTGNAWAAAGMTRVLATIQNSPYSDNFKNERSQLTQWANELHVGFYDKTDQNSNMNHNYVNDTSTFLDGSSSTLMAASVYRLATLSASYHYLPYAERYRSSMIAGNNIVKIDGDGWLSPVVNPLSFAAQGDHSPESQSFVLLMESAYRDWAADGKKGANAGFKRLGGDPSGAATMSMLAVAVATIVFRIL